MPRNIHRSKRQGHPTQHAYVGQLLLNNTAYSFCTCSVMSKQLSKHYTYYLSVPCVGDSLVYTSTALSTASELHLGAQLQRQSLPA